MGATLIRTLPLRVAPIAGEALDSWLEAIAARYNVPLSDVIKRCGMQTTGRATSTLLSPSHDEIIRISAATGIGIAVIEAMTWQRYPTHPADAKQSRYLLWLRHVGSRYCPQCLRGSHGRWPLAWRLNWTFACVRHRCLLADSCFACGTAQRQQPLCASRIPRLGRCPAACYRQTANTRAECNADLGAANVLRMLQTHPVLSAQATIDALLDGNPPAFALYGGATPQDAAVLEQ
ncbi:TniQ family protein [Mycobacterium avium]|uniref:TniQ family protein n=1 Tax=Mycobacterium avium TaxID=1764 RepID=UPI0009BD63E2